jgi:DinB family protein
MRYIIGLLLTVVLSGTSGAAQTFKPSTNPVTDAMRDLAGRHARNLIASAELLPGDKYPYQPTPAQMTFRQLIAHIALTNVALCSGLSPAPPPASAEDLKRLDSADTSKDALVAAIKQSFDYCSDALTKLTDAQLSEQASIFGRPAAMSRASVLLTLAVDWADHYSTAASYLRLNGILPPSAQPKK